MNKFYTKKSLILLILMIFLFGGGYLSYKFNIFEHLDTIFKDKISIKLSSLEDKQNIIPIVVIGSGPAGLSSALYGARAAYYTVVFEGPLPGGQLTQTTFVENWPGTEKLLGSKLIDQNKNQAEKAGAIMVNDTIECVDFSVWPYRLKTGEGHEINALSVIIATGAVPKTLNITGETEYWGKGVTSCAVCDAPFFKDKNVIIVGGGDSAIEEATLLASYATQVKMVVRGSTMRASPAMQARLKDFNNINIIYNSVLTKIIGDNNLVNSVELQNVKDNSLSTMPIDGVFLAIGHVPKTEIFKDAVSLDSLGYIKLNHRTQETDKLGVFAAGDVADHRYRQAGTAAGYGIMAALDDIEFLQKIGFTGNVAKQFEKKYYDPSANFKVELKKIVTNNDFDALSKESKPLVIEVGAEYCPSCKVLLSAVQSTAAKLESKINFVQIDLGDNPKELQQRFEINSIPVLLIFKDGKLISRFDGKVFSKFELYNLLNHLVNQD